MGRSLWSTLHDGTLERVDIEDGLVSLTFDVPHVREEASLGEEARFVLCAQASVSLSVIAWNDPETPRPKSSDATEAAAWRKLGTMRSVDWDAFAKQVAASGMAVIEAEIEEPEDGPRLFVVRGDLAPVWHWLELHVEAETLAFRRETGEALTVDALDALGEAYWEAWNARRPK